MNLYALLRPPHRHPMHRLALGTLVAALMATLPFPALADEPAGTFTLEEVLERAGDSALVRIAEAELTKEGCTKLNLQVKSQWIV